MSWKEENNSLKKSFQFKNFIEAWSFMTKVAMIAENGEYAVIVMDLQGKQLQKTTSKEVDLSKLSSGIYLIKVKLKNNETWTSKVIKN